MLGAGLLAKKAVEAGLTVAPYIKTSLRYVVPDNPDNPDTVPQPWQWCGHLLPQGVWCHPLPGEPWLWGRRVSFLKFLLGHLLLPRYGCMTCIGNSGPLPEPVVAAVETGDLVCCGVLSGNR